MSRYSDQIRDEYGRTVPKVSIYVYKWDAYTQVAGDLETLTDDLSAPLANPLTSDADGIYYFNSADGQKLLEYHYGGKVQERSLILVGALPVPQATFGGLFINAATLTIPIGMDLITTTGYSTLDQGAAVYTYDAAVNSAYVTANPKTSFISANSRGFRLSDQQSVTPQMVGVSGTTTFYVRNDGSDVNDGLSNTAAGAFLTLQKAVDYVFGTFQLTGNDVIIQAADGTRTAGFSITHPQLGKGDIFILGNVATPANCPVNVTGADAFHVANGATIWLRGFKPTTTTSGASVVAYNCATINMQAMDFGACAASQIECGQGSTISLDGAYTISGGAVSHLHCGSFGLIASTTFLVTITGTPAFSSYFAGVAQGDIVIPGMTFTGAATGQRYLAHHGGLIRAAGIDPALPGDVQGIANAGGIYIASVVNPWVIAPDTTLNNSVELRGHNTTSGVQTSRFVTRADASGSGNFYCDADNSFSSGETWFGNDARTVVASGTNDGLTLYSKTALATGSFPVFEMSGKGPAVAYMRRRLTDGVVVQFNRDTTNVGSLGVTTTGTVLNSLTETRLNIGDVQIATVVVGGINLLSGKVLTVNSVQVVGARDTGWTADTGTAKKTANATYTAGTTLTYSAAYVQAEQTAMATRVAALEAVIQNNSQTIKALKDMVLTHGLAGA